MEVLLLQAQVQVLQLDKVIHLIHMVEHLQALMQEQHPDLKME